MGYPIRRCKCGVAHECPLMDPVENGRRAQAALRRLPRITGGKIDVRREVAEPSQADTSPIQDAEIPANYWSDLAREVATWPRLSLNGNSDDEPEPIA